eukprot:764574-Hanusia_phi.AAC.3
MIWSLVDGHISLQTATLHRNSCHHLTDRCVPYDLQIESPYPTPPQSRWLPHERVPQSLLNCSLLQSSVVLTG